jgi:hypothetical protein
MQDTFQVRETERGMSFQAIQEQKWGEDTKLETLNSIRSSICDSPEQTKSPMNHAA